VVLSRKGEDFTQKELESKRVKSSRIKPKEEKFQKPILGDNVLYTHHTEHTNILKEHINSVQGKDPSPSSSFPSLTPLLHLSYFHQQKL
jgi:hypothetical protein